jgi:hypothetical protein
MRTLEAIKNDLDAVGEMITDAEKRVSSLVQRQRQLRLEWAKKKYGVEVGTVVIATHGARKGEEVRVTDLDVSWQTKPWVLGNPKKKNGEWGIAVRYLYDQWRVKEE